MNTIFNNVRTKKVPIQTMEALSGETIYLPCNISTAEGDRSILILWFRDEKATPVYRYVRLMVKPPIYLK